MMKFLRTAPTRRLLAALAGLVIVVGGGTAIAVAASSGGPVPPPAGLASAIHSALGGPQLQGFSADINFTNHLIDASSLQGSDPLLSGASGRVWYSPSTHQLRIELQSSGGDAEVLVDQRSFWISDPRANTVYEGTIPADAGGGHRHAGTVPGVGAIQDELSKLARHLDISGAIPSDTGGQPTYTVRVTPKHDGGLLGAAQLAFDALRGIPLDFAVYASHDASPVLELQASNVSYGAVDPSVFAISPAAGEKVVRISAPAGSATAAGKQHHKRISGLRAVAASVPFTLAAPATAAGLPQQTVRGLDWGGKPGALITYGKGLGGIAVVERVADGHASAPAGGSGLTLPTVSIAGTTAHELDTALGTVIMFDRGGVSYTVLGSVPPTAAEAAARDIVANAP